MAKIIELFPEIVSSRPSDETILVRDETISCFGADIWKQRMVIKPTTKTAGNAGTKNRRQSNADPQLHPGLRLRAGASVAGLSDSLPGIGTFAYNGSPVTSPPQALMVAAK